MRPRAFAPSSSIAPWAIAVSLVLGLALAFGGADAGAHKRFAKKEGVKCKECHMNPEGGGPRNLIGQYYQAKNALPLDREPQTMKLVQDTVDRWITEVMARPPNIRWTRTHLDKLPTAPKPQYERATDSAILRRLSLDLRGTVPTPQELERLESGQLTLEAAVDEFIASKDFQSTFLLYHKDLIRPRTGDYNTDVSHSRAAPLSVDGVKVWSSTRLAGEVNSGKCNASSRVRVSPWWDRAGSHWACADTARTDATATTASGESVRCDTADGQKSGKCGCGPYLLFCYPDGLKDPIIKSMKEEAARLALEVINTDQPYSTVLTADWTMLDGGLEVFYAKLDNRLLTLTDPDYKKPWRKMERHERHSGILSTPEMFNFFYNGRRWSQRVFEVFFGHDVFPDFDLLDDTKDAGDPVGVAYRDSPLLEPSLTVTESRACASCHIQLDGLARVKDRWDPFGVYHEKTARGFDIPQKAIFLGQEIDGVDGLGKALAASDVFSDAVVNQLWNHMLGHKFLPHENATRLELLKQFEASNRNFKQLIKAIARSDEYRARTSLKIMTKETYTRAMGRATNVAWKVGDKVGWDVYYDKVGGMDYRKIELRDKTPGQGHSLVQMKGAAESCNEMVSRDLKATEEKPRLLVIHGDPTELQSGNDLERNLRNLYARAFARPWKEVPDDDKEVLRDLYARVGKQHSPPDGWRAVCTAVFGSEDFALF